MLAIINHHIQAERSREFIGSRANFDVRRFQVGNVPLDQHTLLIISYQDIMSVLVDSFGIPPLPGAKIDNSLIRKNANDERPTRYPKEPAAYLKTFAFDIDHNLAVVKDPEPDHQDQQGHAEKRRRPDLLSDFKTTCYGGQDKPAPHHPSEPLAPGMK